MLQLELSVDNTEIEIDLIADTYEYTFDEDLYITPLSRVKYIDSNGDAIVLKKLSKFSFDNKYPDLTSTSDRGEPTHYTFYNNNYVIYPYPSTVTTEKLLIPVHSVTTTLSADGDSPDYADYWDETIKRGTLWRLWNMMGTKDQAADNLTLYNVGIEMMKRIDSKKKTSPMITKYYS